MKRLALIFFVLIVADSLYSQEVNYHVSNENIYRFLDELANDKVITLNSAIKPYSRKLIALKLQEANEKRTDLNKRQKGELDFYLKDFRKELNAEKNLDYVFHKRNVDYPFEKRVDLFYYKDTLFTLSVNPILGLKYYFNESGYVRHRWNGVEAFAYISDNWGAYFSFRDNSRSVNLDDNGMSRILVKKGYLTQLMGEDNKGGDDFSEMRGGLTYSWNWGNLSFVKDHLVWGNNYNGSNILSGRTPSIVHIKLNLKPVKWFDFNYFHGWLVSEIVDTSKTYNFGYGASRKEYFNKYIAANMFTITPFKNLNVSAGNSIIYSRSNVQAAYLIPIMFFKPIEHTIGVSNEGNAQIFFDISSRQIKHLHLYGTFFIDEVNFGNFWDEDKHSNWFSWKAGFRVSNFPIQNISLTTEYTRTNPMVYKHYIPTTTFESNQYNLGHYLRDNAQELYFGLDIKPIRGLNIGLSYLLAEKGTDYEDIRSDTNYKILGLPFMDSLVWSNNTFSLIVSYEIFNDGYIFAEYVYSDISGDLLRYTTAFLHGRKNTFSIGVAFGF